MLGSGCEVTILGVRPSFCEEYVYNPSEKNLTDAMENALDVLKYDKHKPIMHAFLFHLIAYLECLLMSNRTNKADMAAIYYEKIDVEGHHHGPRSPEIKSAVRSLDQALQFLQRKIKVMLLMFL